MSSKLMAGLQKGHRDQTGITGLETAIILIAFVTVAAVFGYAILSAGIFSAEKGKETVFLALEEAKSTMEPTGNVIITSSDNTSAKLIKFSVRTAVAGEPIDMSQPPNNTVVAAYIDKHQYRDDIYWTRRFLGSHDGDTLLEIGEQVEITIDLANVDGAGAPLLTPLTKSMKFTVDIEPPCGALVVIERVTPCSFDSVMNLH